MPKAVDDEKMSEQLKMLFDYTKFHIGVYLPAATLLATVAKSEFSGVSFDHHLLAVAAAMVGLAGVCGGVIASSLFESTTLEEFYKMELRPFGVRTFSGKAWARCEHVSFWIGAAFVVGSLVFAPKP